MDGAQGGRGGGAYGDGKTCGLIANCPYVGAVAVERGGWFGGAGYAVEELLWQHDDILKNVIMSARVYLKQVGSDLAVDGEEKCRALGPACGINEPRLADLGEYMCLARGGGGPCPSRLRFTLRLLAKRRIVVPWGGRSCCARAGEGYCGPRARNGWRIQFGYAGSSGPPERRSRRQYSEAVVAGGGLLVKSGRERGAGNLKTYKLQTRCGTRHTVRGRSLSGWGQACARRNFCTSSCLPMKWK
jgi:hypothetical protein